MAEQRLTSSGITLAQVWKMSKQYYRSKGGDDKEKRSRLDCKSVRFTARNNMEYDNSQKKWIQVGRDIKMIFIIKTNPVSYRRIDTVKNHVYEITLLLHNFELGMNSPFHLRVGGLKRPIWGKKGDSKAKRIQIANSNVKRQCQMQFIVECMYVYKMNNILFGPNFCTRPPRKTNPKNKIFFPKHFVFLLRKVIIPLFRSDKFKLHVGKLYK